MLAELVQMCKKREVHNRKWDVPEKTTNKHIQIKMLLTKDGKLVKQAFLLTSSTWLQVPCKVL